LINFDSSTYTGENEANFQSPGVTTIGVSTSKYGLGPYGTAVLLYGNRKLRRYQYYSTTKWNGGIYFTPNLTGSRYGSAVAGSWAKMLTVGKSGYKEKADSGIIIKAMELRSSLLKIKEVDVITPTALSILAFRLKSGDTYNLADYLRSKGWSVVNTINPAAISYMITNGKPNLLISSELQVLPHTFRRHLRVPRSGRKVQGRRCYW